MAQIFHYFSYIDEKAKHSCVLGVPIKAAFSVISVAAAVFPLQEGARQYKVMAI